MSARLFSDVARLGRKTSGRASARVAAELDGFLDGGQCPGPVPVVGLLDRQVVQRRGEVGEEDLGAGFGQGRGGAGRLLGWRPVPRPGPRCRTAGPTGCSATWPGRGGRPRGGLRPGRGSEPAASWMEASAPARSPLSDCWTDRLFSDVARSGRKTSGRASARARRSWTASWMEASAPARSPLSDCWFDRLFSDAARSGRKTSGRASARAR